MWILNTVAKDFLICFVFFRLPGNGKFNDFTCWEPQAFICSHPYQWTYSDSFAPVCLFVWCEVKTWRSLTAYSDIKHHNGETAVKSGPSNHAVQYVNWWLCLFFYNKSVNKKNNIIFYTWAFFDAKIAFNTLTYNSIMSQNITVKDQRTFTLYKRCFLVWCQRTVMVANVTQPDFSIWR